MYISSSLIIIGAGTGSCLLLSRCRFVANYYYYSNCIGALRKYHEVNGKLPDRIIVYRDGVGDGQVCVCGRVGVGRWVGGWIIWPVAGS